jgi:hypothetical protein
MTDVITWSWTLIYGGAFAVTLLNLRDAWQTHTSVVGLNGATRRLVTFNGVRGEALRMLTFASFFLIGVMAILDLFAGVLAIVLVLGSVPVFINSILDRRYRNQLLRMMR